MIKIKGEFTMVLTDKLNRAAVLAVASLLFLASLVPLLTRQKAAAYGLMPNRSITMSTSQVSATNTTYHVRFDVATDATAIGGIVVDFCDESPIIGDTNCTAPAGFTLTTPAVSGQSDGSAADPIDGTITGDCDIDSLTTAAALTTHTLALTNSSPTAALGVDTTCFFDITTVTNPSTVNHSFYARIMTYDTEANALAYDIGAPATNPGTGNIDAGGIALSTAEQITVTAKVQERLTFCVYTFPTVETNPGDADWHEAAPDSVADNNCGGKTGSDVILGDVNGVLDPAQSYVDKTAYFSVTTNASHDAAIRMKGETLQLNPTDPTCDTTASCSIDPIYQAAPGDGLPGLSTETTEQFGMCAYVFANDTGATLGIADGTPSGADYSGSGNAGTGCDQTTQSARVASAPADSNGDGGTGHGGSSFTFDATNTGLGGYGQVIATKGAGGYSTGNLVFLGNISNTTEPGIYKTTLTFIATGTY
jgi:hypothetical protein